MIKAITFDFWETLFHDANMDAARRHRRDQVAGALGRAGFPVDADRLGQAMEEVTRVTMHRQEEAGVETTPEEQLSMLLGLLQLPQNGAVLQAVLEPYTTTPLTYPPQPMDGVKQTLQALAARRPLAVICNTGATPGRVLRTLLLRQGLIPSFRSLIFSNEVRVAKPDSRIFQAALAGLGVQPHEAVHVGDNPRTDVAGARAAGMKAIWFNSGGKAEQVEADATIHSLRDLLHIPLLQ